VKWPIDIFLKCLNVEKTLVLTALSHGQPKWDSVGETIQVRQPRWDNPGPRWDNWVRQYRLDNLGETIQVRQYSWDYTGETTHVRQYRSHNPGKTIHVRQPSWDKTQVRQYNVFKFELLKKALVMWNCRSTLLIRVDFLHVLVSWGL